MFDIGWSEFVLIAVVALIAIGPKELPGVLRTVGQWMAKARKMAAEFQSQFQEEMADLKKGFDEVKEAASGFGSGNLIASLQQDVTEALKIDDNDRPATAIVPPSAAAVETPASTEPLAVTPEVQSSELPQLSAAPDELKDAKAS